MVRRAKSRNHQLAILLPEKTIVSDSRKQNFVIEKEFARGGFGRIYAGHQENSSKFGKAGCLAIKVEPFDNGPLFTEIAVFQRILRPDSLQEWIKKNNVKHLGLPPHLGSGIFTHKGEKLRFLVMPRYGRSLENYRVEVGGSLSTFDAFTVARQCSDCLWYMQEQDYVHADLKADNILLSSAHSVSQCYLVDFGLARIAAGNVEKADKKRAHNGTAIFTSLDAHRGFQPSWRGDLEILTYNIFFWITGSLPWQKLESQIEKVFAAKEQFSKNYERELTSFHQDMCGEYLAKLFRMAYETSYLKKINYEEVNKILDDALKSCSSLMPSVSKRKSIISSPKKSVKNHIEVSTSKATENTVPVVQPSRRIQKAPVVRRARKAGVRGTPKLVKSPRIPSGSATPSSAVSKSLASGTSIRKSPRIAREKIAATTPATSKRKCLEDEGTQSVSTKRWSPENHKGDQEVKLEDSFKCEGSVSTSQVRQPRVALNKTTKSLRKPAAPKSPLHVIPSGRSPEVASQSAIAALIPGVRNMKTIRRSLGAALLRKYIGMANKPRVDHLQQPSH
uniref:non-specific serine/threonine protein kinase n=1 Tax=Ascaris suum TaxID=6253 RepID=F1L116_ASCSU